MTEPTQGQPRPRVACDGVAPELLSRQLAGSAGALADLAGRTDPSGKADILVIGNVTADRLMAVLARPFRSFVEFQPEDSALPERIAVAGGTDGFYLALTTPTAYRLADTAHYVCRALRQRGALPEPLRPNVEIALHEVIANAILHGNLGLESPRIQDESGYQVFLDDVQAALGQDRSRTLWITVTASWTDRYLDIAVTDEGEGFPQPERIEIREDAATAGRGLAIVHALAGEVRITDEGRRTLLRFYYDDE